MPGYTFEFTLTPEDFKAYQINWWSRQQLYKRAVPWALAAVLFMIGLIVAQDVLMNPIDLVDAIFGVLWPAMFFLLAFYFVVRPRLHLRQTVRRLQREDSEVFKPQSLSFSPVIVSNRTELGTTDLKWQALVEVIVGPEAIYLMLDSRQALLLPFRTIREHGHEPGNILRQIREWRAAAPSRVSECPQCGYDLEGTTVQGCPECGWAREATDSDS